ncbi:MAG TPA: PilZ domain-containing protein [Pseudomonadales bacterium]|nr:PilZ domain-containing protein [Pseudomonadales bacterium]
MFFKRPDNDKKSEKQHPYFAGTVELLNEILKAHILLNVSPLGYDSDNKQASTMLLQTEPEQGFLVIDELSPREKNQEINSGSQLKIDGSIDGTHFSFTSAVQKILLDSDNIRSYQLVYPERVSTELQREAYRVNISVIKQLKVALYSQKDNTPLIGYLRDISSSGFRVEFKGKPEKQFSSRDAISKCVIHFPDDTRVECQAKVMHVGYNPDLDIYKLGCKFAELPGQSQRAVNRFINDMQREIRRKDQGEDLV